MEILKIIKDKYPEYDSRYEDIISRFTLTQGGRAGTASESDLIDQGKYFLTKYEIFMYAFFLGLRNNNRVPFPENAKKNKFIEIKYWQPEDIRNYIIMASFAKSEIDLIELEEANEEKINNEIGKLKSIIEEYANGGFEIIMNKFNNEPEFFGNNNNCFILMLNKSV